MRSKSKETSAIIARYRNIVGCWYSAGWRDPWNIKNAVISYEDNFGNHFELVPKHLGIRKNNHSMFALLSPFLTKDLENAGYQNVYYEAYLRSKKNMQQP